jgi:hypothetical protein
MIKQRTVGLGKGKLIVAALAGAAMWVAEPSTASAANAEIDYFGKNLFAGIAYHRYGCAFDGPYSNSVTDGNTYQGFTQTQYCGAGATWNTVNAAASTYYGYTSSGNLSPAWLGYYFCYANWDYGEAMSGVSGADLQNSNNYCHSWQSGYSNNSTADRTSRDPSGAANYCSYNVLTNCNSDCWIGDFSTRQGAIVPTLSPCL